VQARRLLRCIWPVLAGALVVVGVALALADLLTTRGAGTEGFFGSFPSMDSLLVGLVVWVSLTTLSLMARRRWVRQAATVGIVVLILWSPLVGGALSVVFLLALARARVRLSCSQAPSTIHPPRVPTPRELSGLGDGAGIFTVETPAPRARSTEAP